MALTLLDGKSAGALAPSEVLARTSAPDPRLRETAWAILRRHPEWAPLVRPQVRRFAEEPALDGREEQTLAQLVVAFLADRWVATAAGQALGPGGGPAPRQVALIALVVAARRPLAPPLVAGLARALEHPVAAVRAEAVRAFAVLRPRGSDGALEAIARRTQEGPALRVQALRALAQMRPLVAGELKLLVSQLDPARPPLERLAAAELLASSRLDGDSLMALIGRASADALLSPGLVLAAAERAAMLPPPAAAALGAYLVRSIESGWTVPPDRLTRLAARATGAARVQLEQASVTVSRAAQHQRRALDAASALLTGGDRKRGHNVFVERAACGLCHRVGEDGGTIGPDLTKIGAIRSGPDLLESLFLPSASFAQGYEPWTVTTRDGRTLSGVRTGGTDDAVTLRDASGAETQLRPEEIATLEPGRHSLMPDGLLGALSPQETRDLLAYLQALR